MQRENIEFDKNKRFVIEITTMSEYITRIAIIYDGVRHMLGDCFSLIYKDLGYDELVYNENGAVIIKKINDNLTYFCGFDAIENKFITDQGLCETFYKECMINSEAKTLSRRF